MGLLSALLFLAGLALIVGGIVAAVANRVAIPVGRDRVVRTNRVPSGPLVIGGVVVMLVPSEGGGLILDLSSLTPTPSTPPAP